MSAEVVDHAPCPVLLVRSGTCGTVPLAVDGSEPAATATALVASWPYVLRSRGRTGLASVLLGSVARNVLHSAAASVLIVRR